MESQFYLFIFKFTQMILIPLPKKLKSIHTQTRQVTYLPEKKIGSMHNQLNPLEPRVPLSSLVLKENASVVKS